MSSRRKGDWCENHGDNFSHFCHWPLESEEEEMGLLARCRDGSAKNYMNYIIPVWQCASKTEDRKTTQMTPSLCLKYEKHFQKMYRDVGMAVPKTTETRCRDGSV